MQQPPRRRQIRLVCSLRSNVHDAARCRNIFGRAPKDCPTPLSAVKVTDFRWSDKSCPQTECDELLGLSSRGAKFREPICIALKRASRTFRVCVTRIPPSMVVEICIGAFGEHRLSESNVRTFKKRMFRYQTVQKIFKQK